MNVVIFVGPSLPREVAQRVLPDAALLPPARQADLLSAVETYRPDVIGLIDGVFGQSSSVWYKEILFALERGVRVFGAASMGALRAVELAPFGMVGVGEIYRRYASGELHEDDEVAVAHASEADGFRPLSVPLVNLRASVALARAMHVISAFEENLLLLAAKSLYFPERSVGAMLAGATARGLRTSTAERLDAFLGERSLDLKRHDAELLLRVVRDQPFGMAVAVPPRVELQRSVSFETMYDNDRSVRHDNTDVPLRELAAYAALHRSDFDDVNTTALNRALVLFLAEVLHVAPTETEIDAERARFRARRGLADDIALEDWLRRQDLGQAAFAALMRELATCRRLQHWLIARDRGTHHTRWILDELRLRDSYSDVVEATALQVRLLDAWNLGVGTGAETLPEDDPDVATLAAEHERAADWHPDAPLDVWAEEAGFETAQDLALALARTAQTRGKLRAAARAVAGLKRISQEDRPVADSVADASADSA